MGGRRIISKALGLSQLQTSRKEITSQAKIGETDTNEADADEDKISSTEAVHDLTEQIRNQNKEPEFSLIQVIDNGDELPAHQQYTGLVCNIKDTTSETRPIRQADGSTVAEEVFTAHLNNVLFSVSGGRYQSLWRSHFFYGNLYG
ncbi:hypothetical protein [Parablautia muri]|uniref:Uncharacterized protein n=1 Tax=Parablautia muri TaxID=2320879 RepID=A0A9X5GTF7_9FIRM|nr:hypothetical protein [Parablautia muri]NBJ94149.1 hypothetical protein [Parablautia muri]